MSTSHFSAISAYKEPKYLRKQCSDAALEFNLYRSAVLKLRIAIFTPSRVKKLGAGDWKQAERTVEAMKSLGAQVDHILIDKNIKFDLGHYDVIHFMPFYGEDQLPFWPINNKPQIVATSSVYWDSWRHRWISQFRLSNKLNSFFRYWSGAIGRRIFISGLLGESIAQRFNQQMNRFKGCDIILPNTVAELSGLYRSFLFSEKTSVMPIPNGVDPPPEWAWQCKRPSSAPKSDYILCPGVFSPRKNQLGLIQATKNGTTPIVFMGGAIDTASAHEYYEICRKAAKPHHIFLGKVEHRSELFYALMLHARVCCLASSCETPGIAALESAMMGARVAITREGGAEEYLGESAVYFSPIRASSIRQALEKAWKMGRDIEQKNWILRLFSWETTAQCTLLSYYYHMEKAIGSKFN